MEWRTYNYRFAEQIFESQDLQQIKYEILDIVKRAPVIPRKNPKGNITTDQDAMNDWFEKEFTEEREWEPHPFIGDPEVTKLQADFKKRRVQVEVQFGNIARAIYDIFKMQASYGLDMIDIGVLILPMQDFSETMGDNIAYFQRVARELPLAKMSITLPIWVIGIAPKVPREKQESGRKQAKLPG